MIKIKITYKDGSFRVHEFSTQESADYFLANWAADIKKSEVV